MSEPIVYDLCCGLGGWTEGFMAEGYRAIGYDIESHEYGDHCYPGELRIKSIMDLNGADLADAACIVASPPCQRYSYMAMPWSRAKEIAVKYREDIGDLNDLFNACFRIQREASIAAGRHVPLVVENVKGAQPWVGRAAWHYGSFYLWGDVPALMPSSLHCKVNGFNFHQHEKTGEPGGSFQSAAVKGSGENWSRFKNTGEVSSHWNLAAAGVKNPGGDTFKIDGRPCGKLTDPRYPSGGNHDVNRLCDGVKIGGSGDAYWRKPLEAKRREATAVKNAADTFEWSKDSPLRNCNSKSSSRKAASALIAKIPFELSSYIARHYKPR